MTATEAVQNPDILLVAILSFLGVITTAVVTWTKLRSTKQAAKDIAVQVLDYLDTGNAHTAGQSLARLEVQVSAQSDRLDRVEVIAIETHAALDQHISDVAAQAQEKEE